MNPSGSASTKTAHVGTTLSVREECGKTCDVEGYSLAQSGHAAYKACVDVCLEGKGISMEGPSSPSVVPSDRHVEQPLAAAGARAARLPSSTMSAAQRLLAKLQHERIPPHKVGMSLAAAAREQGVRPSVLPRADAEKLERAEAEDSSLSAKEARIRAALHETYQGTVRQMRTYQAARLANAADLEKAAASARQHDAARIALDSSLVSAAQKYASKAGAAGANLVDLTKAKSDLARARGEIGAETAARNGAAKVLAEERELWKDSRAVIDRQLAASRSTQPGARVERAQWAAELRAARGLPARTAAKVERAESSQAQLAELERAAYRRQRTEATQLSHELRALYAARMANSQLLAKTMTRSAEKSRAGAQLAAAQAEYARKMAALGGAPKGTRSPVALQRATARDERQAAALDKAAMAAAAMLAREPQRREGAAAQRALAEAVAGSGAKPVSTLAAVGHRSSAQHVDHRGGAAAAAAVGKAKAAASAAGGLSHPRGGKASKPKIRVVDATLSGGVAAVRRAAKGLFSLKLW